jgi:hypothetical protein
MKNEKTSAVDLPQKPHYRHVLKTSSGVIFVMTLHEETGRYNLNWSRSLTSKLWSTAVRELEYIPWIQELLSAWDRRTGKKALRALSLDKPFSEVMNNERRSNEPTTSPKQQQ